MGNTIEKNDFADAEHIKAFLARLWEGDIPLFQTFWTCFLLVVLVLEALGTLLPMAGGFFGLLALAWSGFMVMPVMRAANFYEGEAAYVPLARAGITAITLLLLLSLLL